MNFAGFGLLSEAANRVTLARQFRDIGNRRGSAGSSRQNVRVSSEGETLLTAHHPTIRHILTQAISFGAKPYITS